MHKAQEKVSLSVVDFQKSLDPLQQEFPLVRHTQSVLWWPKRTESRHKSAVVCATVQSFEGLCMCRCQSVSRSQGNKPAQSTMGRLLILDSHVQVSGCPQQRRHKQISDLCRKTARFRCRPTVLPTLQDHQHRNKMRSAQIKLKLRPQLFPISMKGSSGFQDYYIGEAI